MKSAPLEEKDIVFALSDRNILNSQNEFNKHNESSNSTLPSSTNKKISR